MKMDWQEEFNQAMEQFGFKEPEPLEFRIHYDDHGKIIMCSMCGHPASDQYLVVDRLVYDNYLKYQVNVARKKLEKIDIDIGISVKLRKSTHGYAVVKSHAGLLVEKDEIYNDIEYYDSIN